MSHRHVEWVIGRLVTDADLRQRFGRDPSAVLRGLTAEGHEFSGTEIDALVRLDPEAIQHLTEALDARLRRAGRGLGSDGAGG